MFVVGRVDLTENKFWLQMKWINSSIYYYYLFISNKHIVTITFDPPLKVMVESVNNDRTSADN